MPYFVGDDGTQNNGNLELSIVLLDGAQRMIVVDTGKNRNDCKTKDSILKLVLGWLRKHPQHDVGSFERLQTPTGCLFDLERVLD
jgi:hypothetical protein